MPVAFAGEIEMAANSSRKFFGLLTRRERWGLSFRGWLAGGIGILLLTFLAGVEGYPYLAITEKVQGEFLVVEGWIPPETLKYAVAEFQSGQYQMILTSGGVVRERLSREKTTYANWAASDLKKLGVPENLVNAAPCWYVRRDRTYSSALAVKAWLESHHLPVKAINLVTLGPHARRSRLLYEEAFGGSVKVGVIAIPSPDYDPQYWWRFSEGVRDVIGEEIAYVYARFFFWPWLEKGDGEKR